MMKTNMGLDNFRFSYINDFDDEMAMEKTQECVLELERRIK